METRSFQEIRRQHVGMLGVTGFDNREIVFLNGRLRLKIADDPRNGREILRFSRTKDRAGRP